MVKLIIILKLENLGKIFNIQLFLKTIKSNEIVITETQYTLACHDKLSN